jgi:hypothetical protein
MTDQPSLFEVDNARARGPIQSQLTVSSLGRDTTLKFRIAAAIVSLSTRVAIAETADGRALVYYYDRPVTDDAITAHLEAVYDRRFQRNVIARTRGLMEQAGWFIPVPDVIGRTGRPTHAAIPSPATVAIVHEARS